MPSKPRWIRGNESGRVPFPHSTVSTIVNHWWGGRWSRQRDAICVCVKTPRNTVLILPNSPWWKQVMTAAFRFTTTFFFQVSMSPEFENLPVFNTTFSAGGMAVLLLAMPTKLWSLDRKRMWTHILVPALLQLLTSCYTTVFPSRFRLQSVCFPSNFRSLSIFFRRFPSNFQFHLNSTWTNYDNLVYDFSLMTGYFRTNFNVCVNRGLWDNLSLPRTTPDKHVELSSVCVSPPGATSSRLDGPSEKVQVRKPQLMFPNGTREAFVPWIKGRTAGPLSHYSQSGTRI